MAEGRELFRRPLALSAERAVAIEDHPCASIGIELGNTLHFELGNIGRAWDVRNRVLLRASYIEDRFALCRQNRHQLLGRDFRRRLIRLLEGRLIHARPRLAFARPWGWPP